MGVSRAGLVPGSGLFQMPGCKAGFRIRVVGNDHFCDTTKRVSQRLPPHKQGEIPLYHRSGNTPLDSTTQFRID